MSWARCHGRWPRAVMTSALIMPLYRTIRAGKTSIAPTGLTFNVPLGNQVVQGSLWRAQLPGTDVPVYLVEQAGYFERDDPAGGRGLYQFAEPDGGYQDYPDNSARFIFFCRAVLEALCLLDTWPDVLHLNDWQTGLIPVYLREVYGRLPSNAAANYHRLRTLLTIHNLAYQGVFPREDMALTGLSPRLFNFEQLEFHNHLNFLKAGIVFADLLNTVSPTYAREIQTRYFGCGLQHLLRQHAGRLFGIVNGADYSVWDPATDRHIAAGYTADSVAEGKPRCKAALQQTCRLPVEPGTPLLGIVSRLAEQKGIDLLAKMADRILRQDVHLVVLGQGDAIYHEMFTALADPPGSAPGCRRIRCDTRLRRIFWRAASTCA